MTTLTVLVDPRSKRKYKLNSQKIEFRELRDRILRSEGLTALENANSVATKRGLRKMTLKEIESEIAAARHGRAGC